MTTPTYTSPFTGTVVTPTDVSYYALSFSANTQLYWPAVVNGEQVVAARIIDCVASTTGLTISLPDATQGAVGTDILFRNLGLNSFVVRDANGGGSFTVGVGMARYVYLTDNTSVGGVWGNVEFGAGTSFADAAQLQGAGLTTIAGKLATTQNLVNVTSTPVSTITDASRASTFVWGGGAGTFNLPALSSLSSGWYIGFRNNGTGALTLTPVSPTQINNQSTIVANPGDSGYILYDESLSQFVTVGLSAPANITFTSATYDVDSIVGNTFSLVSFAPIIQKYIAQTGSRTQTLTVTLPATTQLYILINDTNESGYNVQFVVSGSLSPPLVVTTGNIATVLCDGQNIFLLTQTSSSQYFAINGVEAAPSFSFLSDTTTGMYLPGAGILGLTANSVEMINIDNSNVLQPQVTINAELTANLISGGTF
jgi:hypothetical protein